MAKDIVNVNEYQDLARQSLPKMFYDFIAGGADDQYTLKENVEAFSRIKIQPRILVDVSKIDMSASVLGYKISAPIMIAPTSMHKLAHHEGPLNLLCGCVPVRVICMSNLFSVCFHSGEVATARAAASCNTIMVVSFSSTCTVEEVASSCNAVRFFQLYVYKKREVSAVLVQRAERNGYKALVLTTDTPRLGKREADIKNKLIVPELKNFEGLISTDVGSDKGSNLEAYASQTLDSSLCWKDIEWLRSITMLPILIKGVLTREDAIKAMEVGVDGIIVSNHGGRQLDYVPSSISVLEEVVVAVGGKIPILLDGGVRRGTDIFKALALGAQAALIGRPVVYGLAVEGEKGVKKVVQMLKDELELCMTLAGCPSIKEICQRRVSTTRML